MKVNIALVGAQPDEQAPQIALYSINAAGQVQKKLALVEKGSVELPGDLAKQKNAVVALGPDVADLKQLNPEALFQLRLSDQIKALQNNPVIEIPSQRWRIWPGFRVCVAGQIKKCFPFVLDTAGIRQNALGRLPFPPFEFCFPMCNGVVEVWERTCCCFPILVTQVPNLIARLRKFIAEQPIKFPPPPPPPPIDPEPIDRAALDNVNRALALGKLDPLVVPNSDLHTDLLTLESLPTDQALQYFQNRPSLWPIWCSCSSAKKGETTLNPDGSFNFCFWEFPFFPIFPFCRKSYFYKVKQFLNGHWVYVYDGLAAHQYFTADQFASLSTFGGQACGQQPPPPGEDFATLQAIGFTQTYDINSHYAGQNLAGVDLTQIGATSLATPPDNGGLRIGDDAPWAKTLSLLLYFHEGLQNPAIGAVYYRLSVVAADNAGNPLSGATPDPIINPVTWSKFVDTPHGFAITGVGLGPNVVGGTTGLFTIPYGTDWLNGQFHQTLDTTLYANHNTTGNPRYMVILELFDAGGNRIVPTGAKVNPGGLGSDTEKPFNFLRLMSASGPDSTAKVPYAALTHLLWFDNRPCYGAIEDFDMNGTASSEECQFLKGPADSNFQVGYRAFHTVMGDSNPPPRTFMQSYSVSYQRGLNGPSGTLASGGDTNQPASMFAGANVRTPAMTFQSLLGDQTACSFAINLNIYCKHTNGFGHISDYDVPLKAAVAIEIA